MASDVIKEYGRSEILGRGKKSRQNFDGGWSVFFTLTSGAEQIFTLAHSPNDYRFRVSLVRVPLR